MAFMRISQAETNTCQNTSAGQRGGCLTPIPGSPNQHDLSSCQTSCSAAASSPRDRTLDAISCTSHKSGASPCERFIPIASHDTDPGIGSHHLGSRENNIYFRKRSGRSRGWKRPSKSGGGKSTDVKADSKRRKTTKMKTDGTNKHKQMAGYVSALEQPYRFYKRAMVVDPWTHLKPVVGCILVGLPLALESPRLWLPDSVVAKEPEVGRSNETSAWLHQRRLKQDRSLADCLALSFEEAANR